MGAAGVQHTSHKTGCSQPSGGTGQKAAAEAGQRDWDLPCPAGAVLTMFWFVMNEKA